MLRGQSLGTTPAFDSDLHLDHLWASVLPQKHKGDIIPTSAHYCLFHKQLLVLCICQACAKDLGTVIKKHNPGPSGTNSPEQIKERPEARRWVHSSFSLVDSWFTST